MGARRWVPLAAWLLALAGLALRADPRACDPAIRLRGPDAAHWLGTDALGRDLAARIGAGGLTSLAIGLAAAAAALAAGGSLGLVAGYAGGKTEKFLTALADLQQAIPSFLLALALVAALGAGGGRVVLALTVAGWPGMLRIARALARQWRGREFLVAARALGAGPGRILFRHLLPAVAPALAAHFLAQWAGFMLAESGLSYLGLGLQPPRASWGVLMSEGADHLLDAPRLALAGGAAAVLTAWLLNRAAGSGAGVAADGAAPGLGRGS